MLTNSTTVQTAQQPSGLGMPAHLRALAPVCVAPVFASADTTGVAAWQGGVAAGLGIAEAATADVQGIAKDRTDAVATAYVPGTLAWSPPTS